MKNILLKLASGCNEFHCNYNGQERKCKILKLDLHSFSDDKGSAFVRFDKPIKKIERKEVEEVGFSMDNDITSYIDVEVESYEEWVSIG